MIKTFHQKSRLNISNQMTKFVLAVSLPTTKTESRRRLTSQIHFPLLCCYRLNGKENKQEINYFLLEYLLNLHEIPKRVSLDKISFENNLLWCLFSVNFRLIWCFKEMKKMEKLYRYQIVQKNALFSSRKL